MAVRGQRIGLRTEELHKDMSQKKKAVITPKTVVLTTSSPDESPKLTYSKQESKSRVHQDQLGCGKRAGAVKEPPRS